MKRRAAGFTLVEVMLATVLLAGGLALAFASVRSAMAVSQRGEQIAAESERMRAVEALLRRQLAGALRTPLEVPDPTREPIFFQGEEQRMLFAADLPGYLGRGGTCTHCRWMAAAASNASCSTWCCCRRASASPKLRRAHRRCWWRTSSRCNYAIAASMPAPGR